MKRILTVLMLLTISATSGHAADLFQLEKTFRIQAQQTISLFLSKGQYIRGHITSRAPLESAVIDDHNRQRIQTLINPGQSEAELFWKVRKTGNYQITITTAAGDPVETRVVLYELPLKADQTVQPQDTIISPLLKETARLIELNASGAQPQFWQTITRRGTPLIEPLPDGQALATFLWRGKADNVKILGAPYEGHAYMSYLRGSDIWYKTYTIPDGTRLSYRLAPDVPQLSDRNFTEQRRAVLAAVQTDPLNHFPPFGAGDPLFGAASTMIYGHIPDDWYTHPNGSPAGTVTDFQFFSQKLRNRRKISVYQPAVKQLAADAPLLILFDGDDYQTKAPTPIILDNLIAAKKIPPLRAVFINPPSPGMRAIELPPNPEFADFMAGELMVWLKETIHIAPPAEQTILSGSSYGGLASLYIATRHPETFGKVLSQSGSFWWGPDKAHPEWLTEQLRRSPRLPVQIYMNAGLFETKPDFANILHKNQTLYQVLKHKGYQVNFETYASGHDYFSWRVTLANGLISLMNTQSQ